MLEKFDISASMDVMSRSDFIVSLVVKLPDGSRMPYSKYIEMKNLSSKRMQIFSENDPFGEEKWNI